jgi:hypothetical protein
MKTGIFLREGLDTMSSDLPVRQSGKQLLGRRPTLLN